MSIQLVALRHPNMQQADPAELRKICDTLEHITHYKKLAKREEAPVETDCLTAMVYILERAQTDLKIKDIALKTIVRIGSMPKKMAGWGWELIPMTSDKLRSGDLLFLRGDSLSHRLITHVGMAISPTEIFHSSAEHDGACFEDITQLFKRYNSYDRASPLLRNVDPRPSLMARFAPPSLSAGSSQVASDAEQSDSDGSIHSSPSIAASASSDASFAIFSPTRSPEPHHRALPELHLPRAAHTPVQFGHFRSEHLEIPSRSLRRSFNGSAFHSRGSSPGSNSPPQASSLPSSLTRSVLWGGNFSLETERPIRPSVSDSEISSGFSSSSSATPPASLTPLLGPANLPLPTQAATREVFGNIFE